MLHHSRKRLIMDKFTYTGKITLSHKKSDKELIKRYYNTGTPSLFKFFAYALAGKDISDLSPNLLRIGYKETDSSPTIGLTEQPILKLFYDDVSYSVEPTNVQNVCRLQCNIPLSKISDLSKSTYVLQIISMDNSILAETMLTDDPFKDLNSSDQVIIVWDMFVENKQENEQ